MRLREGERPRAKERRLRVRCGVGWCGAGRSGVGRGAGVRWDRCWSGGEGGAVLQRAPQRADKLRPQEPSRQRARACSTRSDPPPHQRHGCFSTAPSRQRLARQALPALHGPCRAQPNMHRVQPASKNGPALKCMWAEPSRPHAVERLALSLKESACSSWTFTRLVASCASATPFLHQSSNVLISFSDGISVPLK